jgi:hypothetical protein
VADGVHFVLTKNYADKRIVTFASKKVSQALTLQKGNVLKQWKIYILFLNLRVKNTRLYVINAIIHFLPCFMIFRIINGVHIVLEQSCVDKKLVPLPSKTIHPYQKCFE